MFPKLRLIVLGSKPVLARDVEFCKEYFASGCPAEPGGREERMYRTGDMGRILADGCLVHLGRKDFQVKIRGYRVEVGEVERMLLEHSGVAAAAVAARSDLPRGERLVAYYVCADAPPPNSSTLRNFLAARLPGYMVPSAFVRLEALPRTPSVRHELRMHR